MRRCGVAAFVLLLLGPLCAEAVRGEGHYPEAQAEPPSVTNASDATPARQLHGIEPKLAVSHAGDGLRKPEETWIGRARSWAPKGARRLLAGLSLASAVKAACMAGNVVVQMSPMPQVKHWEDKGSTGEADAAPYVSIAFGGWQWCAYGLLAWFATRTDGFLILVYSNCLGAVLGTYYTVTFYRYCRNHGKAHNFQQYVSAMASLVLLQVCIWLLMPMQPALLLTGLVASFCSFVGGMSMFVALPAVFSARDDSAICGPLVFANAVSSALWVYCGWMMGDLAVMVPNIFAAFSSSVCLSIKLYFGASRSREVVNEASPNISAYDDGDSTDDENDDRLAEVPKRPKCDSTGSVP